MRRSILRYVHEHHMHHMADTATDPVLVGAGSGHGEEEAGGDRGA